MIKRVWQGTLSNIMYYTWLVMEFIKILSFTVFLVVCIYQCNCFGLGFFVVVL